MKSISEIKKEFAQADDAALESLFALYADDERAGVAGLLAQYRKKQEKLETERRRLHEMGRYDR